MIDIAALKRDQESLRNKIVLKKLDKKIKFIAGCDSSLIGTFRNFDRILSVFVIISYPELKEVEVQTSISELNFPYIPGFLSYREIPNLLSAYEKIKIKPDLIMVDGQGIMHPRHLGIAAHLGLKLSKPTIGVAKKKLYGRVIDGKVYDLKTNEQLGYSFISKARTNPLLISPGNMCSLEDALQFTKATLRGYKLPEPTRIADLYSKKLKPSVI